MLFRVAILLFASEALSFLDKGNAPISLVITSNWWY